MRIRYILYILYFKVYNSSCSQVGHDLIRFKSSPEQMVGYENHKPYPVPKSVPEFFLPSREGIKRLKVIIIGVILKYYVQETYVINMKFQNCLFLKKIAFWYF